MLCIKQQENKLSQRENTRASEFDCVWVIKWVRPKDMKEEKLEKSVLC